MEAYQDLREYIESNVDSSFTLNSRVHTLHHKETSDATFYIKRDDELSFGISGSKFRKYVSLLPFLKKNGYNHACLEGSAHSNHLVGIIQLLIENSIDSTVFVKKPHLDTLVGNSLFLHLFKDKSQWITLNTHQWKNRQEIIKEYNKKYLSSFYLKEGGDDLSSMPGMMTLAKELSDSNFDHIFLDAGTGFSAIAFLLAAKFFKINAKIHILLLADNENTFLEKLQYYKQEVEKRILNTIVLPEYSLYSSIFGRSFGSTNREVFSFIQTFAKKEGVLLDPIYTAKLFLNAFEITKQKKLTGKILGVHSGGSLSLAGFQDHLLREAEDLGVSSRSLVRNHK